MNILEEAMLSKPFVQACENNKAAIADALQAYLRMGDVVLEVGSGTGQHAVYFGERFPEVRWLTSDVPSNHAGIHQWLEDAALANVAMPIDLNIRAESWSSNVPAASQPNAIYLANVIHIIEEHLANPLFSHIDSVLGDGGMLFMYGPFNYGGRFTSEGNKRLEAWLKAQNEQFGIRDFEAVDSLARNHGLALIDDITMPANNRLLVWRRCR